MIKNWKMKISKNVKLDTKLLAGAFGMLIIAIMLSWLIEKQYPGNLRIQFVVCAFAFLPISLCLLWSFESSKFSKIIYFIRWVCIILVFGVAWGVNAFYMPNIIAALILLIVPFSLTTIYNNFLELASYAIIIIIGFSAIFLCELVDNNYHFVFANYFHLANVEILAFQITFFLFGITIRHGQLIAKLLIKIMKLIKIY